MHAAIVAGPARRSIVETAVHHPARCEGCRNTVGVIGIIVVLGVQSSNETSPSRGSERRDRGISIPVVLNEPNDAARNRERITDGRRVVRQAGEGILFYCEVVRVRRAGVTNDDLSSCKFAAEMAVADIPPAVNPEVGIVEFVQASININNIPVPYSNTLATVLCIDFMEMYVKRLPSRSDLNSYPCI